MKKTFYIFILFFLSASAFAQKVTEKNLLGIWEMTIYESDVGVIKYNDNADKQQPPEMIFKSETEMQYRHYGEEFFWHYSILEKEGAQYLHMNEADYKMTLKGKKLILSGEEGGIPIRLTYEKKSD